MEKISQDLLWETILNLKEEVTRDLENVGIYSIIFYKEKYSVQKGMITGKSEQKSFVVSWCRLPEVPSNSMCFLIDHDNNISQIGKSFLDSESTNFLKQYLPFCFASLVAKKRNRSYSVLHLAQSIDGRIATQSGNSKWVSNHENLIHTHRMRALCDAILIGKNTLLCDTPKLTVRFVSGQNPVKVIIANSPCSFENLKMSEGKIILFTSKVTLPIEGVEIITLPDTAGNLFSEIILKELYKRNIYSIFIEGGAITASHFISEHAVDKVQIFISPKIFGSGISSFSLSPIDIVDNSLQFHNSYFNAMGDGILFEGTPAQNGIVK